MHEFIHLHVHSYYSILDGAASVSSLVKKAKKDNMQAIALTEHGNLFSAKEFHSTCKKEGIKPILGVEAYVASGSMHDKKGSEDRSGNHLIILAKNYTGFKNLMKLVSYSFLEGFYYKPRIDKALLNKHKEGLIISSACLGGEIPELIDKNDIEAAEKVALEYKEMFGDDFYLEMQRHKSGNPKMDQDVYERQVVVNKAIKELSVKVGVKYIATNDVHFLNKDDADAHDVLLCINTGKDYDDPSRMRYTRQEYLKSQEEMNTLFADVPEALQNTIEICNKIEVYELNSPPIMPLFKIPEEIGTLETTRAKHSEEDIITYFGEDRVKNMGGYEKVLQVFLEGEYLKHLVYEGAAKRYSEITQDIKDRLDFELATIIRMGFPGYFLIVWDFLSAARNMGVSVGPGRGSAAGSAVAYCLRITDIDPLKYNLLFERFLNPDRISMPDIDIDFDEEGREKILEWVVEKYGQKRVANIVTFGTMAPKMAIRDVARSLKLPLSEADRLAKLVPEKPGTSFEDAFKDVPDLLNEKLNGQELVKRTLLLAEKLEGSVRQTGVHACGIIIGRNDLEENIPLSTSKESKLFVVQYEGKYVEDVGLLKMDFLGLKTLSIVMDAVINIKKSRNLAIDIDTIPLDDTKTYELFSRGDTTALFQFESDGMKKYLKDLKPNRFDDLIAMNALYRPGPIEYIPNFIKRKHGIEKIEYDLAEMEEYLNETYGITVYQEQVMLLSQKIAGFTKGQADSLRKAMGKKIKAMMDDLKDKFIKGGIANGHDQKILEKVWTDWEAFAQYAFNKSHSTCYAYLAYQTAYLKAHFPAEFMAAVLSRNISSIDKITLFMDECKRMKMLVLGPDVNESEHKFIVNKQGNIRFGLGGIKGVGEAAILKMIEERETNGPFIDITDFMERVMAQSMNKKTLEALTYAGAFDNLKGISRHEFFAVDDKGITYLEQLMRYGSKMQADKNIGSANLFGDSSSVTISKPVAPKCMEWNTLYKLDKEKEVVGIYLSAHPLDDYKFELKALTNLQLSAFSDVNTLKGRDLCLGGIITDSMTGKTQTGKDYGSFTLEDYSGSYKFMLFGSDFITYRNFLSKGFQVLVKGRFQERRYDASKIDFSIQSMDLLSEAAQKNVKTLTLRINIEDLTPEMVHEIDKLSVGNNGSTTLKFKIMDAESNIIVNLHSRSKRLNMTSEVKNYFLTNREIDFSVN